jgi:hypothetical protein
MADLAHRNIAAAIFGLLTHFTTNRGEWDHHIYLLIIFGSLVFVTLVALEYLNDSHVGSIIQAFNVVGVMAAVYFATLATSIIVYRAFFHRLRKVCVEPQYGTR